MTAPSHIIKRLLRRTTQYEEIKAGARTNSDYDELKKFQSVCKQGKQSDRTGTGVIATRSQIGVDEYDFQAVTLFFDNGSNTGKLEEYHFSFRRLSRYMSRSLSNARRIVNGYNYRELPVERQKHFQTLAVSDLRKNLLEVKFDTSILGKAFNTYDISEVEIDSVGILPDTDIVLEKSESDAWYDYTEKLAELIRRKEDTYRERGFSMPDYAKYIEKTVQELYNSDIAQLRKREEIRRDYCDTALLDIFNRRQLIVYIRTLVLLVAEEACTFSRDTGKQLARCKVDARFINRAIELYAENLPYCKGRDECISKLPGKAADIELWWSDLFIAGAFKDLYLTQAYGYLRRDRGIFAPMYEQEAVLKANTLIVPSTCAVRIYAVVKCDDYNVQQLEWEKKITKDGYVVSVAGLVYTIIVIMVLTVILSLVLGIHYSDAVSGAGIDPTSLTSLVIVVDGLLLALFTNVYKDNWSWYEMLRGYYITRDWHQLHHTDKTVEKSRALIQYISKTPSLLPTLDAKTWCYINTLKDGLTTGPDNITLQDLHELGYQFLKDSRGQMVVFEPGYAMTKTPAFGVARNVRGKLHVTYDNTSEMPNCDWDGNVAPIGYDR